MNREEKITTIYFKKHERAIIIKENNRFFYSIDTYILNPKKDNLGEPKACLELDNAKLCYYQINDECDALLLYTYNRIEVVNYRVKRNMPIEDLEDYKKSCDDFFMK